MVSWSGTAADDVRRGTAEADRLFGRGGDDDLSGLGGDDSLYGEDGADVLRGGPGDDHVHGAFFDPFKGFADGGDRLYGDSGNDFLSGGNGSDTVRGGAGDDTLEGNDGEDLLYGGPGNDRLRGGLDADRLFGGEGDDELDGGWWYGNILAGGAGDDFYHVYGSVFEDVGSFVREDPGEGDDTVEYQGDFFTEDGTELGHVENFTVLATPIIDIGPWIEFDGNDRNNRIGVNDWANWHIKGHGGDDVLSGSYGSEASDQGFRADDRLEGGAGNDRLIGGRGADTLAGGTGRDDFQFGRLSDSSTADGGRGIDLIEDFEAGQDDLVFDGSADADATLAGRQKFVFIGEDADPGRGELSYRWEGGETLVLGNADDDAAPEFQVRIVGNVALAPGDFLIF
ncbi:hypothetical protein IGS68_27780 (plasmid) [Skermanella sp. TT6]|uniref:Calcium-binding protein n=1 Tax=Skermanella cutis TaxID=2775420 RepID=A0ABX7BF02_9PROT|nr:calcium-binding protein [Skermanella sp. TT6]QQP92979.1 hypothetical protein IGS68_27780 [Skermanella sp. TT6]